MLKAIALVTLLVAPALALDVPGTQPKDRPAAQRGSEPNAGEVRPPSRDGDHPSASAGELQRREARRIFGLPVTAALVIAAVIVAMVALAGMLFPPARRRARARGNGTYGRPS